MDYYILIYSSIPRVADEAERGASRAQQEAQQQREEAAAAARARAPTTFSN